MKKIIVFGFAMLAASFVRATPGLVILPPPVTPSYSTGTATSVSTGTAMGGCVSGANVYVTSAGLLGCASGVLSSTTTFQTTGSLTVGGTLQVTGQSIMTGTAQSAAGFQTTGITTAGLNVGNALYVSTGATGINILQMQGDGSISYVGTGDSLFVATITMNNTTGEVRGILEDVTYSGSDASTLVAARWSKLHYNEVSTATGTQTLHGGGGFDEVFSSPASIGFSFGEEGHNVGASTQPLAYGVGVIGHNDWAGVATSSPTAHQIGVVSRSEITLPDRNTTRTGDIEVDNIGFRDEEYSFPERRRYHAQGLANWAHVAYLGDAFFISTFTQTVAANDTVIPSCGGQRDIQSASAVTTNITNTFSVPNISTTGTSTKGCVATITNTGAFAITLDNNANFFSYGGVDQVLESGDTIMIESNGALWSQNAPMKKASGLQTMKGVVLSGGTGTATYNASGILDELIISSGMAAGTATETTLYTYTLPANTFVSTVSTSVSFPARQSIHIQASGNFANATLEQVKIYFGSTVCLDSGALSGNGANWMADCRVVQTGTGATQASSGQFAGGTGLLAVGNGAPTETITGSIVIKVTGTVSVATANGVKVTSVVVVKE